MFGSDQYSHTMNPFCQNKFCRCHIEVPDGMQVMRYQEANGSPVNIGRRTILNAETRERFYFCEICAHAVAIVFGTKKQSDNQNTNELSNTRK